MLQPIDIHILWSIAELDVRSTLPWKQPLGSTDLPLQVPANVIWYPVLVDEVQKVQVCACAVTYVCAIELPPLVLAGSLPMSAQPLPAAPLPIALAVTHEQVFVALCVALQMLLRC